MVRPDPVHGRLDRGIIAFVVAEKIDAGLRKALAR